MIRYTTHGNCKNYHKLFASNLWIFLVPQFVISLVNYCSMLRAHIDFPNLLVLILVKMINIIWSQIALLMKKLYKNNLIKYQNKKTVILITINLAIGRLWRLITILLHLGLITLRFLFYLAIVFLLLFYMSIIFMQDGSGALLSKMEKIELLCFTPLLILLFRMTHFYLKHPSSLTQITLFT
ncbi:hypothetical protein M0813_25080 [Anaeramoeba flamelloides]|uniref:Uncharacterized protein n=1 Tax=Anaeramoeba flamelloides TaxID=1746091 RepID=A0ABQ8Y464_9EUKA|nr:hypothetical protein M0813_25080 [Anaeramoeba flamelloides]